MHMSPIVSAAALLTTGLILSGCGSSTTPSATGSVSPSVTSQRLLCIDPSDPACLNPGPPAPTPPPAPTNTRQFFEVYLGDLKANVTTDSQSGEDGNSRDEVYMEVATKSSSGLSSYARLPRRYDGSADYYQFNTGQEGTASSLNTWVNRDSAFVGKPMYYVGSLADGESVQLLVTLEEQDNKTFGGIKNKLVLALTAAATGGAFINPLVGALFGSAATIAGQFPDNASDDLLGSFTVKITNTGGVLNKTWLPVPQIYNEKGTANTTLDQQSGLVTSTVGLDSHTLEFSGTSGGNYNAQAVVETVTNAQTYEDRPLSYISQDGDACGSDNLYINGVRLPRLDPDVPKGINVTLSYESGFLSSGNYFHWNCNGTDERTKPDPNTNYVIASHRGGSGNRDIHWYEFKKVSQ